MIICIYGKKKLYSAMLNSDTYFGLYDHLQI